MLIFSIFWLLNLSSSKVNFYFSLKLFSVFCFPSRVRFKQRTWNKDSQHQQMWVSYFCSISLMQRPLKTCFGFLHAMWCVISQKIVKIKANKKNIRCKTAKLHSIETEWFHSNYLRLQIHIQFVAQNTNTLRAQQNSNTK